MATKLERAQALAAPVPVNVYAGFDKETQTTLYETYEVSLWGEAERFVVGFAHSPISDKGKTVPGTKLWWAIPNRTDGPISDFIEQGAVLVWVPKDRDAHEAQLTHVRSPRRNRNIWVA